MSNSSKHFIHISSLKREQKLCLETVAQKRDLFGILPIGFGKSLIFLLLPHLLNRSRLRLHGRGFQSKRFHDLETALKTARFRRVYTEPIQPLNPTVYVRAISFSGVRNIFKEPPLTSYRKEKSLKDTLVRAKL